MYVYESLWLHAAANWNPTRNSKRVFVMLGREMMMLGHGHGGMMEWGHGHPGWGPRHRYGEGPDDEQ
jgi:hypothetical protein